MEISGAAHGSLGINPLSIAAIVTPYLPPQVTLLVARLKRRDATVIPDIAIDPLRRFQDSDGLPKQAAFVECLARATLKVGTCSLLDMCDT